MKYRVKKKADGFVVVFDDGPMKGCNCIPTAIRFPTTRDAMNALKVLLLCNGVWDNFDGTIH